MAQRTRKFRKLAILAKIEATYGVDSAPTGAANTMIVSDVEITPLDGEEVERNNVQPHFGNNPTLPATFFGRIKFNVEIAGSTAAGTAPKYSVLMRGCSASSTVVAVTSTTFLPISDNQEAITIYANLDKRNHVFRGVRGNCKVVLPAKGKPVYQFDFMGLFTPLEDEDLPTVVDTGWVNPIAVNKANTTASLFGVTLAMSNFELDFGNQVVKRDMTDVDTVEINDRKSMGTITFEARDDIADIDWVGLAKEKTLGDLEIVHGVDAGNIITVAADGTVELGKPSYGNQDGVVMITCPLKFKPTSAGNDEWSIVAT